MKITLVQSLLAWGNVEENLKIFAGKLSEPMGCDLILLPEMFTAGSIMVKQKREIVEAEKVYVAAQYERVRQEMLRWAVRQQAVVVGSTVYEEEGNYYNRLVAAFPEGHFLFYDKRHCFRMGGENEYFKSGDQRLVFDFRGVKIAAFICYDLRFPVWCRNVEGYDLALFVANWPQSRREVWTTLLRARAIENQCYVAGVNCVGTDNYGLYYSGDSMVVDAKGRVLAQANEGQEECVSVEINTGELKIFREKFPVLEDRDQFEWIK